MKRPRIPNSNKSIRYILAKYPGSFYNKDAGQIVVPNIKAHARGKFLGTYTIRLTKRKVNDCRAITSIERQEGPINAYQHPHVNHGVPCLGNIRGHVFKLHKDGDLDCVLETLIQFLNSYSDENPFIKLAYFLNRGYCDDCGEYVYDCECYR